MFRKSEFYEIFPKALQKDNMSQAEVEKKPKKKTLPPTEEEAEAMINAIVQDVTSISNFFNGSKRKTLTMPEDAPAKTEYNSWTKDLHHLLTLYRKLSKIKPVKRAKKPKDPSKKSNNRGFKQERFLCPEAATFVNSHAGLPDDLKLRPMSDVGGFAVWTIAQATPLFGAYIDAQGLKNPEKRSQMRLDKPLEELFKPFMGDLKKSQTWTKDGVVWITHPTLQHLVPLLFLKGLPVLPSMMDDGLKDRLLKREALLKERTAAARDKRKADDKEKRDKAKGK